MDGDGSTARQDLRQWRLWLLGGALLLLVVIAPTLAPRLVVHAGRIVVEGNGAFVAQVSAALSLLKQKDSQAYDVVEQHVGRITQGQHSGMWAFEDPPRLELGPRTAASSTTWLAGAIAHDSMHSKLYSDWCSVHGTPAPDEQWIGVKAERVCIEFEIQVLKQIDAPQTEIDWCSRGDGTHADVNGDGKLDWDDYEKRNW